MRVAYQGRESAVEYFLDPQGEVPDLQREAGCEGRLQKRLLNAKHTQCSPRIA